MSFVAGTCGLCRQVMLFDPDTGDAWHPHNVARACPPEPPTDPWDTVGWNIFYAMGLRSGRPGSQYFIKTEVKHEGQQQAQ